MPRVSVIVPTHNCAGYVRACIESVLEQSFQDLELIVVDDGSTDNTIDIIKPYMGDRRLKYIKNDVQRGLSVSRNAGITNASGELVAFLDADDIFLKDKLAKQALFMDKVRRCGISYTNEVYHKESSGREVLSNRYRFSGDVLYFLKRSNFIHVSTVMVRRSIVRPDMFDESLRSHEDWEAFLRLAVKAVRFSYLNEVLSKITVRDTSMTMRQETMARTRSEVGEMARLYWKSFKREMRPFSLKGFKAMIRYLKFKLRALLIDSAWKEALKKPVPQELLQS